MGQITTSHLQHGLENNKLVRKEIQLKSGLSMWSKNGLNINANNYNRFISPLVIRKVDIKTALR